MKLCSLSSGSKGNAVFISDGHTNILIDDGIGVRELERRMCDAGLDSPRLLDAVVITHEHIDHIKGIASLQKNYCTKVFAHQKIGGVLAEFSPVLFSDQPFSIGSLTLTPFRVPHDTVYPLGFTVTDGYEQVASATDLGVITPGVVRNLKDCSVIYLEANHDVAMLERGRYMPSLKKRILGVNGHLSNDQTAEGILEVFSEGKQFLLGHMSEENNAAELVYHTVCDKLKKEGIREGKDIKIALASQYRPSEIIEV